jgi:hypothetical protein
MQDQKAPKDFIEAVKILKKGDIATQVYKLLTE